MLRLKTCQHLNLIESLLNRNLHICFPHSQQAMCTLRASSFWKAQHRFRPIPRSRRASLPDCLPLPKSEHADRDNAGRTIDTLLIPVAKEDVRIIGV